MLYVILIDMDIKYQHCVKALSKIPLIKNIIKQIPLLKKQ